MARLDPLAPEALEPLEPDDFEEELERLDALLGALPEDLGDGLGGSLGVSELPLRTSA